MVGEEKHYIGEIHHETLVVKRDRKKHLMKRWNAYGFNAELVDSGEIEVIVVEEPGGQLLITAENVKTFGRIHQEEGWDKQYFVSLDQFTKV
jgi:hypothetical protein